VPLTFAGGIELPWSAAIVAEMEPDVEALAASPRSYFVMP
jgi:hypothetical protein